jgi:hypothetical protein
VTRRAYRAVSDPGVRGIRRLTFGKGVNPLVSILWIILIVVIILVLLGFFSRGRW